MKHVNRYNGLRGSFDYITEIDKVYLHTESDVDFEDIYVMKNFAKKMQRLLK